MVPNKVKIDSGGDGGLWYNGYWIFVVQNKINRIKKKRGSRSWENSPTTSPSHP